MGWILRLAMWWAKNEIDRHLLVAYTKGKGDGLTDGVGPLTHRIEQMEEQMLRYGELDKSIEAIVDAGMIKAVQTTNALQEKVEAFAVERKESDATILKWIQQFDIRLGNHDVNDGTRHSRTCDAIAALKPKARPRPKVNGKAKSRKRKR